MKLIYWSEILARKLNEPLVHRFDAAQSSAQMYGLVAGQRWIICVILRFLKGNHLFLNLYYIFVGTILMKIWLTCESCTSNPVASFSA